MSSIINNLDYNARLAPSLEVKLNEKVPQNYDPEHILRAVLPLLASVPLLSLGLQMYAGCSNSMAAMEVLEKRVDCTFENEAYCVLQIASLALLFFNPVAVSIIEQTRGIYHNTLNCKNNIVDGQYKNALIHTAFIAKNVVYIASVVTGGPNLILISMVSQGVFELYKSKQFFNKGMYLEALVQSVMAVSRGSMIVKTHQKEITESFESFKTQFSKLGTVGYKSKAADLYADYAYTNREGVHIANYSDGTVVESRFYWGTGSMGYQIWNNKITSEFGSSNSIYEDRTIFGRITCYYNDRKIITDDLYGTQHIHIY